MKKQWMIIFSILVLLVSAGCSPSDTMNTTKPSSTQTQQADKNQKSSANERTTIGEMASIGDTSQTWEDEFGHPYAQGDTLKVYKNGQYKVVFENDRAVTITFPSADGTEPAIDKMLPRDGSKQSESSQKTGDITMTVEKWHSALLEKAIPDTKGMYTIMKNKNGETYDSIVIDCTPNLKK